MGDFYAYLMPSLPMLHFGMKPPFSFERLLELSARLIPEDDYRLLCKVQASQKSPYVILNEPERASEGSKPPRDYSPRPDVLSGRAQNDNIPGSFDSKCAVIKEWVDFDAALKNELVKVRASRLRLEPAPYLRERDYQGSSLTHLALAIHRSAGILEAERIFDQARYNKLEELSFGHYFDRQALVIYAYKLLILERWERIRQADKHALLEQILCKI
jgi:hypothetical protein